MKSFDEINQLADQLDTNGMADQSVLADDAQPGDALGKVGEIYQKVRPFLEAVGMLFFVPKKWRSAILTFIAVMDGLTIVQTPANETNEEL